jgi:hypothetical protein
MLVFLTESGFFYAVTQITRLALAVRVMPLAEGDSPIYVVYSVYQAFSAFIAVSPVSYFLQSIDSIHYSNSLNL